MPGSARVQPACAWWWWHWVSAWLGLRQFSARELHVAAWGLHDAVIPIATRELLVAARELDVATRELDVTARGLHDAVVPVSTRGFFFDATRWRQQPQPVNAAFVGSIPWRLASILRLPATVVRLVTLRSTRGSATH
jgi:hypothetical protein